MKTQMRSENEIAAVKTPLFIPICLTQAPK